MYNMEILVSVVILTAALSITGAMPIGPSNAVLITPNNAPYFASYLHPGAQIQPRAIRFPPGTTHEKLLEVPILSPGEITPLFIVRVTVAMDPTRASAGTDHDPRVGLTDGTNTHRFWLADSGNYAEAGGRVACGVLPEDGSGEDYNKITIGPTPAQFTLLFTPYHKYGACSTGQNGGYVNVVTFNSELDTSKGLSLVLYRDYSAEEYRFHYFSVELLK